MCSMCVCVVCVCVCIYIYFRLMIVDITGNSKSRTYSLNFDIFRFHSRSSITALKMFYLLYYLSIYL